MFFRRKKDNKEEASKLVKETVDKLEKLGVKDIVIVLESEGEAMSVINGNGQNLAFLFGNVIADKGSDLGALVRAGMKMAALVGLDSIITKVAENIAEEVCEDPECPVHGEENQKKASKPKKAAKAKAVKPKAKTKTTKK